MANKIQIRRGLKTKLPTLSAGEPAYATDTSEFYVGTGSGNVNMGGSHWYTGIDMSASSDNSYSDCPQVKLGDMYLNTSNGYIYQCTEAGSGNSAKWTYKGCIKGNTGAAVEADTIMQIFAQTLNHIEATFSYIDSDNTGTLVLPENTGLEGEVRYIEAQDGWYDMIKDLQTNKIWYLYTADGSSRKALHEEENAIVKFGNDDKAYILMNDENENI